MRRSVVGWTCAVLAVKGFRDSTAFVAPVPRTHARSSSSNTARQTPAIIFPRRTAASPSPLSMVDPKQTKAEEEGVLQSPLLWFGTLVLPLWLVYISNQWSRGSIYYLVDFSPQADPFQAMNVAIGFDQAQYGLLASVAFTALYSMATVVAGVAADRFNRKTLTLVAATGWTLATVGTAYSDSYSQILVLRVLMGLCCAFCTPTAYTLIRDQVPADRQALASSLYGTGVAVASALASLSLLLDQSYGWQNTLLVVSLFGGVSTGLTTLLLPNDPKTTATDASDPSLSESGESPSSSIQDDIVQVVSTSRAQWIFLGSFLRFCSGLCIGVWGAPYYRQVFADRQGDFAVAQALISAVGATASGILGGVAADWLSSSAEERDSNADAIGQRLWVPVIGSVLAAPAWYMAMHSETSFETAMTWLAIEYAVAECWFGPTISTLQATVGKRTGGTAQGLFTLTGGVANLAPSLLGFLYGSATSSQGDASTNAAELANLLATGVCLGYISSAICFGIAAQATPVKSKEA